jgi:DNA-binding CsgD family transcriptional regulator
MTAVISDSASAARRRAMPRERSAGSQAVRGREPERKIVRDLLRRAQRGDGGVVLVDGEPGIGKSWLLRACTDEAAEHGFSLAAGAADQLAEAIPLFALRAALGEPFAGHAADDPGPDRPDATAWWITQARPHLALRAVVAPVLVCLDDLHWADQATLAALRTLPGKLKGHPVAWPLARSSTSQSPADRTAQALADSHPEFPALAAAAAHSRGLAHHDPAGLAEAAAQHPGPWARASAAEDLGVLLGGQGDRDQAIHQLKEALGGYRQVGAERDQARVRQRLRKLGIRRRHWSTPLTRPVTGWDSLTDTEQAVAGLVAEGLNNHQVAARMYISTHTVAHHLRQTFRKLSIASRVELTRIVIEQTTGVHQRPADGGAATAGPQIISGGSDDSGGVGPGDARQRRAGDTGLRPAGARSVLCRAWFRAYHDL